MKPLNLEEFAEELRLKGDSREIDFADMILQLLDIEKDVAEPYWNLCDDIEHYAKDFTHPTDAAKALEWIGDRSDLLKEIEDALKDGGREPEGTADTADAVRELLGTMTQAEALLERAGWPGTDFIDALEKLIGRAEKAPPAMEYDL